jgi:hypothetical protein
MSLKWNSRSGADSSGIGCRQQIDLATRHRERLLARRVALARLTVDQQSYPFSIGTDQTELPVMSKVVVRPFAKIVPQQGDPCFT